MLYIYIYIEIQYIIFFLFPRSIVALRCDRCFGNEFRSECPYFAKSVPRWSLYLAKFMAFHLSMCSCEGGACSITS